MPGSLLALVVMVGSRGEGAGPTTTGDPRLSTDDLYDVVACLRTLEWAPGAPRGRRWRSRATAVP